LIGDTVNEGERSSWNGQRAEYSRPSRPDQLDDVGARQQVVDEGVGDAGHVA
jgi:hypothetical protein